MPPSRTQQDSLVIRSHKANPKTPRQQNTACAPCRKRRVKCDRKDAPTEIDNRPTCTECFQRSFQCVDDPREAKPQKLLRRGRKIQELEKIYSRAPDTLALADSPYLEQRAPSPPSAVPQLDLSFFESAFYRRFHIQRPVVDPTEFIHRYKQYVTEGVPLGTYGELIAKLLATWAASYGVNERGEEEFHDGFISVERRREATNIMVKELLATIDKYSVMRNISWDGVRVLLLLMPLTEEVQPEVDRANMYQSTVLQVYTLSNLGDIPSYGTAGGPVNQMVRARIFWYGHVHEGLTNGLKGRKLIFDQDDVEAFKTPLTTRDYHNSLAKSNVTNSFTYRYATAPIRLSAACRMVNAVLTGPRAERRETVDRQEMEAVWSKLAESWEEFEDLRRLSLHNQSTRPEEADRFVSGWQIFIFEAYNIIREKIYERIVRKRGANVPNGAYISDPEYAAIIEDQLRDLHHLHEIAESKCHDVAGKVMTLINRHLNTPFFEYDASLCRDGVYYCGELMASEPDADEQFQDCLMALKQMRWAYSKGRERTKRLKARWAASRQLPRDPRGHDYRRGGPLEEVSSIGPGHLDMTYSLLDPSLEFPRDAFEPMSLPSVPSMPVLKSFERGTNGTRRLSPDMMNGDMGFASSLPGASQSHILPSSLTSATYGSGASSPAGSDHSLGHQALDRSSLLPNPNITPPPNFVRPPFGRQPTNSPPSFQTTQPQQRIYDPRSGSSIVGSSTTIQQAFSHRSPASSDSQAPLEHGIGSHSRTQPMRSPTSNPFGGDNGSQSYSIGGSSQSQATKLSGTYHMDPVALIYEQPSPASNGALPSLAEMHGLHDNIMGVGGGMDPGLSGQSFLPSYSNPLTSSQLHQYPSPSDFPDYTGPTINVSRHANGASAPSSVSSSASSPYTNSQSGRYNVLHPLTIPNPGIYPDSGSSAGPHKNSPLHESGFGFSYS
ncbi:hypothetical protein FRC03_001851 [Tulasnella sp. 419]|nr:hypothetical protein FRC03_001851 [Tulasnella sp. 419]